MDSDSFYNHYLNNGFVFSNSLLTRYCLSLYTKPFVILSGISGTGKTKIAQLFNTYDGNTIQSNQEVQQTATDLKKRIILNVTQGVLNGDRGNFRIDDLGVLFETDEMTDIQSKIDSLKRKGDGGNIIPPEKMLIETQDGKELKIAVYLQRASSPLIRVRFKSKRGDDEEFDSSVYMRKNYKLKDVLGLEKVGKRRFRIVSKNEKELVEMSENIEKTEANLIDNSLFVSVKSNWTDSTELFGYYNMLSDKYQMTDLLRFLMTARDFPEKPFFLILDEMNLSKVEYYFSDFLSCLESRYIQSGEIKQEPISLHGFNSNIESNDNLFDAVPNKIEVPTNLYVTGTVNIDETTYMFSPKVLDRANVIEFNEVSLENYSTQPSSKSLEERFKLKSFPSFGNLDIATMGAFNNAPSQFQKIVKELLEILTKYNLHFGYRVINEMALYMRNVTEYVGDGDEIISDGIDHQISQKILPKFSGAYGKLDEPLRELIGYLCIESIPYHLIDLDKLNSVSIQEQKYPLSIKKLVRMYQGIIKNGFTSFLE